MLTTVKSGNQVTIPALLAEKLGITPGVQLDLSEAGDNALLLKKQPDRAALATKLCGAGAHLSPGHDACAQLDAQRESEDEQRKQGA